MGDTKEGEPKTSRGTPSNVEVEQKTEVELELELVDGAATCTPEDVSQTHTNCEVRQERTPKSRTERHLLMFIHGMAGDARDWRNFIDFFERESVERLQRSMDTVSGDEFVQHELDLFVPTCNHNKTLDGVLQGASRLQQALEAYLCEEVGLPEKEEGIAESQKPNMPVKKKRIDTLTSISFLGHSLGGVYARALVQMIYDPPAAEGNDQTEVKNKIQELKPLAFITFATPHCGVKLTKHANPFPCELPARMMTRVVGKTTQQLCLLDKEKLLVKMTDRAYLDPLNKFARRVLYSNVNNDILVDFYTSSLTSKRSNPYGYKARTSFHLCTLLYKSLYWCKPASKSGATTPGSVATIEKCKHFSNLTLHSLSNGTQEKAKGKVEESVCQRTEPHRCVVHRCSHECCRNALCTVEWERYDVHFPGVKHLGWAHEHIVWQHRKSVGQGVVKHCFQSVFVPWFEKVEDMTLAKL